MEKQADRLVNEIRSTRARLGSQVNNISSPGVVVDEVRRHPLLWIGGGLLAGLLVGRLWGPELVRRGRRRVETKLVSQAQMALGSALLAAFGPRLGRSRRGAAASPQGTNGGGPTSS